MMAQLQIARIGALTLSYRERGSGTPVMLIHGLGGSSQSWSKVQDAFLADARMVAWDAPGYGSSPDLLVEKPTVDDYVRPLIALMRHLELGRAHVVGHSMGALMVTRLANLAPDLVASLCLVHPVLGLGRLPAEKREEMRAARLRDFDSLGPVEFAKQRSRGILGRKVSEEALAASVRISEQVSPSAYRHAWEMMVGENILPDAQKIRVPTLIIGGSDDPVASPAACTELAQAIPDAMLIEVEGVGHNVMIEATDQFERLYRDFLGAELAS